MLRRRWWVVAARCTSFDRVARARAPLAALVRRPSVSMLQRLAGLVPGARARIDPDDAAAYDEASRAAFLAAVRETSPASIRPAAFRPRRAAPPAKPIAPLIQQPESGPTSQRSRSLPPGPAAQVPIGRPGTPPAAQLEVIDHEKAKHESAPSNESAPGFPMQSSRTVDSVADDFFDSLIRRVEDNR